MGCTLSKPDKFDQLPRPVDTNDPNGTPDNAVAKPSDWSNTAKTAQPLNGKLNHQSTVSSASSTPDRIPSTKHTKSDAGRTPKKDRSSNPRPHDSDEDSDWDNCSAAFDLETQTKENGNGAGSNSPASVSKPPVEPPINFKQTATLRIDKVKGCMFVNQYLVVKFLGRGACGKVFLCLNTHDLRLYAMKAVRKVDLEGGTGAGGGDKKRNPMEDLKREIMIMKKMRHPNIVTLSEVIDDPAGSKLLLVMEFMEGGPVMTREALEKRERVPESLARKFFRDMVKSLDYLHSHKVVHGDLKPENVLMSAAGDVKLSDFGCSKVFVTGNEYLERCNGTPAFLAPEMMKPNTRYRGRPTDVYALGACLYTLVFGRIPFSAPNLYKLFQVVQNEAVKYPEDVPTSPELKNLLHLLLTKNPRERISLGEVMRHPWLSMNGRFPLKPCRELKENESQELHPDVAGGLTYSQCHPQPDFLAALANATPHERMFLEGDVIIRQGDTGVHMLYIVNGCVDVLIRNTTTVGTPAGSRTDKRSGRPGDESVAIDESDPSAHDLLNDEVRVQRTQLAKAATKARDLINNLLQRAGGSVPGLGRELLVAQRGPGEMVGEMALFTKDQVRTASIRCATRVVAKVITHDQLFSFMAEQPLLKYQLKEVIWKRESEATMVEALSKMANVRDALSMPPDPNSQFGGI